MRNRPRLNPMTLTRGMRERLSPVSNRVEQLDPIGVVDMNLPSPYFVGDVTYTNGGVTGTAKVGVLGENNTIQYRNSSVIRRDYTYGGKLSGLSLDTYGFTNFLYDTENLVTSWVATNLTKPSTPNAIGPDGLTSAVTLTATGSTATLTQTRGAVGAGFKRFSVWLRRVSGSGDVEIASNTAAYSKVTVTSEWQRFEVVGSSSVIVGIRLTGSSPFQVIDVFAPTCTRTSNYWGNAPEIVHSAGSTVVFSAESLVLGMNTGTDFATFVFECCTTRQVAADRIWSPPIGAQIYSPLNDSYVDLAVTFEPDQVLLSASVYDGFSITQDLRYAVNNTNIARAAGCWTSSEFLYSFNGEPTRSISADLSGLVSDGLVIRSSGGAIRSAALYGVSVDPSTISQLSTVKT
jgi:hypothetical protein